MFPYLDVPGFRRRSIMAPTDVDLLDNRYPGFIAARIALRTSYVNSRLRKRYGTAGTLPLGQTAPAIVSSGLAPPSVSLQGRPIVGSLQLLLQITTAGILGGAVFAWSLDGGVHPIASAIVPPSWVTGVATASAVDLPGSGLIALFSPGSYSVSNLYAAATPVPETVLGWLVAMVTLDALMRRGANPDPTLTDLVKEHSAQAEAELKEAADSKEGLFDLPASEDLDSAISTGGPESSSETSPYVWTDMQACIGHAEDFQGRGT